MSTPNTITMTEALRLYAAENDRAVEVTS